MDHLKKPLAIHLTICENSEDHFNIPPSYILYTFMFAWVSSLSHSTANVDNREERK